MRTDGKTLFGTIDPPPGGAAALRVKLRDAPETGRLTRWRPALAAAVLAALAVFVVLQDRTPRDPSPVTAVLEAPEFDRLLGRATRPNSLAVTVNDRNAPVTELLSSNGKVRIYQMN